jgi:integrase
MSAHKSRTKLTAVKVANVKPHPDKRIEIPDAGKPGLFLVVQPNGRKSWAIRYRRLSDRKTCKLTMDGFPPLTAAHKWAQAALDRVAEGGDPSAEKQAKKRAVQAPTLGAVGDAFRFFMDRYTRTKRGRPIRESTRRETGRLLGFRRDPQRPDHWVESGGGVLAKWKGKTVQSIRPDDVRELLDELVDADAGVKANRTLTALKTCFTWLHRRDPEALPRSPCDGIDDPAPESPRERTLSDVELAAVWRAAAAEGYPYGDMVRLLVLTGCRRDEARDAPWSEIDLGAREWSIPGRRTKNGRDHLVPIVDQLASILEELPRIQGAGLLFTTTGETSISGLAKYKRRLETAVAKELGAEPTRWTLHDLRRTLTTGLQKLGFPVEVTEAVLNHSGGVVSGVAAIYGKHDYRFEKEQALAAWARHVDAIVSGKAAKVVAMRKAEARAKQKATPVSGRT